MERSELTEAPSRILTSVSRYVQGRDETVHLLIAALLAGGHVLVEGLPGTAKTLVAKTFAEAIGGTFHRIQLTPDMLPGDVTGFEMYRPEGGSGRFLEGPLFANVVLADELNRTTPRTQSAFLEAMQEHQVTVDGTTHPLPSPFLVIASQVPFGGDGTYPLTEVQADRFMLRIWSGYPSRETELHILELADALEDPHADHVTTPEDILALREKVKEVHVSDLVRGYILDLVERLRESRDILLAPGPRASLGLFRGSRALAFLDGRDFVLPDDVRRLSLPVLEHRVRLSVEAELEELTPAQLVEQALAATPVPKGVE